MNDLQLKVVYRLKEIKAIKAGKFPIPHSLTIYPSEVCNMKCIGCNSTGIHKKNAFMDLELFTKIVSDFSALGGRAVAFEGGGEPTMHPQLDKMILFCCSKGLKIGVITNGTHFIEELAFADWVRISISNSNFITERVTDTFKTLMTRRKITKVGIKFLRSKVCPNPHWYYAPPDYIQIKDLRNHPDSLKVNPDFVKPCGLTPLRAVVDYDGTFYPCPYFYSQKKTAIGKGLISEFWGKEAHQKAIKNIKNCNLYDCPMLDIDLKELEKADLDFI